MFKSTNCKAVILSSVGRLVVFLRLLPTTVHEFAYLTNKDKGRGKYISMERLALNAMNKTMDKIIQKFDPIRFEVGYNEWKKQ